MNENLRLTTYEFKCWDEWKYQGKRTPGACAGAIKRAENKLRRMGLSEKLITGAKDDNDS